MHDLNFAPMPWMGDAACRGITDADVFFPNGNGGIYSKQVQTAKDICRTCPVTDACLQRALDLHPVDGIWGGTTESERRQMNTNRNRRTCA